MIFGDPFGGVIPGAIGAVLSSLLRTDTPLTGRQIHALVCHDYSLWSVQEALKQASQLGLVHTRTYGRAGVHTINEKHYAVPPLRALLDPIAALVDTVRETVSAEVKAVVLFGSIARGEADPQSDIDLAVLATARWDGRADLVDAVRARLGNDCDVLVFTPADFSRAARDAEPVAHEILNDGIALYGSLPPMRRGVA